MNQKKLKPIFNDVISKVAEKTLGELAFMLIMPQDKDENNDQIVWGYGSSVEFTGPFSGRLFISITSDMMEPLATNMLGLELGEEPPEGVKVEDALRELLNVICGNLLPVMASNEVVFNIAGPEMLDNPNPQKILSKNQFAGESLLHLDSGTACLRLFIDDTINLSELQKGML